MTFSQLAAKLLYSFGSDCANNKVVADRFLEPTLEALTAAHNKAVLEARFGMLEYFDQVPRNEDMEWKGLFADVRKQLESDRAELTKEKET